LLLPCALLAQSANKTTRLYGTVTDSAGASIDGVTITLTQTNGRKFQTSTSDGGNYSIKIPPGAYTITFVCRAWSNFVIDKYVVLDTDGTYLGIAMRVDPEFTKVYGDPVPADLDSISTSKPGDKRTAVKLIEPDQLTKKIADQTLEPLWKTIKCDEPVEIFVINYGPVAENHRRVSLITDSWHLRCEFSQFRGFTFVDGGPVGKPRTVIWKVPIGAKPPEP
jgi:hypothetical protein